MMEPVIFLDIDGVLNGHYAWGTGDSLIDSNCVKRLNDILTVTKANVVLSSAWRYQVIGGTTTLKGFQYLLISHGVDKCLRVVGHTPSDEEIPERGDQILKWIEDNKFDGCWIVLDDLPLDKVKDNHVRTDPDKGLTDEDVQKALSMLCLQSIELLKERLTTAP